MSAVAPLAAASAGSASVRCCCDDGGLRVHWQLLAICGRRFAGGFSPAFLRAPSGARRAGNPVRAPESLELHLLAGRVELVAARTLPLEHRAASARWRGTRRATAPRAPAGERAAAAAAARPRHLAAAGAARRPPRRVSWMAASWSCHGGTPVHGARVCVLLGEVYAFFGGHLKGLQPPFRSSARALQHRGGALSRRRDPTPRIRVRL